MLLDRDSALSQPASVHLGRLFRHFEVQSVDERTLTGNQRRVDACRLQWASRPSAHDDDEDVTTYADVEGSPPRQRPLVAASVGSSEHVVVDLAPMEIRTFHLQVRRRWSS